MLYNSNILVRMDISLCGRLWINLIVWLCNGNSRQSFVMFSVGLSPTENITNDCLEYPWGLAPLKTLRTIASSTPGA